MLFLNEQELPDPGALLAALAGKEPLSAERLQHFQSAAETYALQGAESELQENNAQAECWYRRAFVLNTALFRTTGAEAFADAAVENCTSLADLCMQQGNMHGADYYYGLCLRYRPK